MAAYTASAFELGNFHLTDTTTHPSGAFPQIINLTSRQDEIARVANEVETLVKQGFPKKLCCFCTRTAWGEKFDPRD